MGGRIRDMLQCDDVGRVHALVSYMRDTLMKHHI